MASAEPSTLRWDGCEESSGEGAPPEPGDTWWPVVGPPNSLEQVRIHCRSDAFVNKDGNVQVASFRDQSAAASFSDRLSSDMAHPFRFYVGYPTTY
jgi:hypothetical protein